MQKHFYTPRKGAEGLGSARAGTLAHWALTVTGAALAVLTPFFVFTVLCGLASAKGDGAMVVVYFGRPFPAIVTGLFLTIGLVHWMRGTQVLIDDYLRHAARNWALVAVRIIGLVLIAVALWALVRISLGSILISALL